MKLRLLSLETNSLVRYTTREGFVNLFPITFEVYPDSKVQVLVGFSLKQVNVDYQIKLHNGIRVVEFFEDLQVGLKVTVRRVTPAGKVPHTFHYTGNAKGSSEFNQKTMDENFEYLDTIVGEVEDFNTISQVSLGEIELEFKDTQLTAEEAKRIAQGADAKAESAIKTANRADTKADGAVATATQALDIAKGADGKSDEAIKVAIEAKDTSEEAKGIAEKSDAKADDALLISEESHHNSEEAIQIASESNNTAEEAKEIAVGIEGIAKEAVTIANEATGTATEAKAIAEGIEAKADSAIEVAKGAEVTANKAELASSEALSTAEGAKATAEGIEGIAVEAKETAGEAQVIAEEALSKVVEDGLTEPELVSKSVGSGKWMREGAYGLGGNGGEGVADISTYLGGGFYRIGGSATGYPGWKASGDSEIVTSWGSTYFTKIVCGNSAKRYAFYSVARGVPKISEIYTESNTRTDKNNVLHSGTHKPIDTLNVSDMAQDVVNRDDLTVTSGAVYRGLEKKRDKTDNVFSGSLQLKDNDGTGTGMFLMESDGTIRGQMVSNSYGLQFSQIQDDGSSQNFTFPRYGEGGEIVVDSKLGYVTPEMFGAICDGDGNGGGTDNTDAFNKAYASFGSSGGVIRVPFVGTGIYCVNGKIHGRSNVSVYFDNGVTVDFSNQKGGSTDECWLFQGSFGEEVKLGANATRGETVIETESPHGLKVGDYFLLHSQRNAIHEDAGVDWQLGIPTGSLLDAHACYFAEPCQVQSVVSNTRVRVTRPIIFPSYRVDDSQETSPLAKPYSTIRKINFLENAHIYGGRFIADGTTVFRTSVCKDHGITDSYCYLGKGVGSFIQNDYSLYGKFLGVAAEHSNEHYIEVDHSNYNSFKSRSDWFTEWDYTDICGTQGLDVTYVINGTVTIAPKITFNSYDAHEMGLTFHAGCYQWQVNNPRIIRPKQTAIQMRSRFGQVNNIYAIGRNTNDLGAILFQEFGTDIVVNGGVIDGFRKGFVIGSTIRTHAPSDKIQPIRKNISFIGTQFIRCDKWGDVYTHPIPIKTNKPSGVRFLNIQLSQINKGMDIHDYVNFVVIKGINLSTTKLDEPLINVSGNSFANHFEDILGDIDDLENSASLVSTPGTLSDTGTFPETLTLGKAHRIINVRDLKGRASIDNMDFRYGSFSSSLELPPIHSGGLVYFRGGADAELRISGHGGIFLKGEVTSIINLGTANFTIKGVETNTTIESSRSLTVQPNDIINIMLVAGSKFIAW